MTNTSKKLGTEGREQVKEIDPMDSALCSMSDCSLWINVARTDVPFMMHAIPHIVRMCNYPFVEKVLAIDTAPLSGEKINRPGVGSLDELRGLCAGLKKQGVVDRVVDIDYSADRIKAVYQKHLGHARIKATHNYKGYPVYGSMWCIEEATTEYFLHFDSDMLLYQQKDFNWVARGIEIIKICPDVFWTRAMIGPQNKGRNAYISDYKAQQDKRGFYKWGGFSSRCYLIDRKRFESILPLKVLWAKNQGAIKDRLPRNIVEKICNLTGRGLLESWEVMVANRMKEKSHFRADIADDRAWTLHPPDHGAEFIRKLPDIIRRVEEGNYPSGQAGRYDLELKLW